MTGRMLCFLLILSTASSCYGAGDYMVESLHGLKSVEVLVEDLNEDARRVGLDDDRLKTIVELQLRKAGIPVEDSASAVLYLNVNIAAIFEVDAFSYAVNLQLNQGARLIRNTEIFVFAPTWHDALFGIAINKSPIQNVKECCRELADEFINDYLEANLK